MSLVSKLSSLGFAVWFAFSQIMLGMSTAYAQSDLIDVEPPLIEHSMVSAVEASSKQSFFATVVDDDELESVSLYYRFQNDPAYSAVSMKRVSYSSTYIGYIPTDPDSARTIEYYIQARDKAGNRTVRGYAFNPLVREINIPSAAVELNPTQASPSMFESIGKRKTVLYVVLGVLAVGALAASLNTGSTGTSQGCPDDICAITINVGRPN